MHLHLFCVPTNPHHVQLLSLFLKGSVGLEVKTFTKALCWEHTRTRSAWLGGSQAVQLALDEQKHLGSGNLFPLADELFTHLERHLAINTETEEGVTQRVLP